MVAEVDFKMCKMIYEGKIYGPYLRKDGRQHVVVLFNKKKITVSYPKFLVENHINRKLSLDETIDHINKDFSDNNLSNLRIINKKDHSSQDVLRIKVEFICPICEKHITYFNKRASDVISNKKRGRSGPYCSRKCAGKGGSNFDAHINVSYFNTKESAFLETERVEAIKFGEVLASNVDDNTEPS